jgi:hypothetical protein
VKGFPGFGRNIRLKLLSPGADGHIGFLTSRQGGEGGVRIPDLEVKNGSSCTQLMRTAQVTHSPCRIGYSSGKLPYNRLFGQIERNCHVDHLPTIRPSEMRHRQRAHWRFGTNRRQSIYLGIQRPTQADWTRLLWLRRTLSQNAFHVRVTDRA